MIKAIFFDWFNTLARFDPPREQLHIQALRESGINLTADTALRGLLIADRAWFEESAKSRTEKRSPQEQLELGVRYEETLLTEAGIKPPPKATLINILKKVQQLYQGITFVLFDDVLPTLKTLKEKALTLGLLTNVAQDMSSVSRRLGLEPLLDFIITSQEAGADKPQPPIFLAALERAGVEAGEAIHVGDQYQIDVLGARGVGIGTILIDRYNQGSAFLDCPRIRNLTELLAMIPGEPAN